MAGRIQTSLYAPGRLRIDAHRWAYLHGCSSAMQWRPALCTGIRARFAGGSSAGSKPPASRLTTPRLVFDTCQPAALQAVQAIPERLASAGRDRGHLGNSVGNNVGNDTRRQPVEQVRAAPVGTARKLAGRFSDLVAPRVGVPADASPRRLASVPCSDLSGATLGDTRSGFSLRRSAAGREGLGGSGSDRGVQRGKHAELLADKWHAMSHLQRISGYRPRTGRPWRRCARRRASVRSAAVGLAVCR